jgi:hypothetical protein
MHHLIRPGAPQSFTLLHHAAVCVLLKSMCAVQLLWRL